MSIAVEVTFELLHSRCYVFEAITFAIIRATTRGVMAHDVILHINRNAMLSHPVLEKMTQTVGRTYIVFGKAVLF